MTLCTVPPPCTALQERWAHYLVNSPPLTQPPYSPSFPLDSTLTPQIPASEAEAEGPLGGGQNQETGAVEGTKLTSPSPPLPVDPSHLASLLEEKRALELRWAFRSLLPPPLPFSHLHSLGLQVCPTGEGKFSIAGFGASAGRGK